MTDITAAIQIHRHRQRLISGDAAEWQSRCARFWRVQPQRISWSGGKGEGDCKTRPFVSSRLQRDPLAGSRRGCCIQRLNGPNPRRLGDRASGLYFIFLRTSRGKYHYASERKHASQLSDPVLHKLNPKSIQHSASPVHTPCAAETATAASFCYTAEKEHRFFPARQCRNIFGNGRNRG